MARTEITCYDFRGPVPKPPPEIVAPGPPSVRRPKKRWVQRIEYLVYRLFAGAAQRASEERVARWGTRLGAFSSRVLRSRDRLAMRNLQSVFPEKPEAELRRILDECWRHFGREMLLFVQMQPLGLDEIARRCPLVNRQLLDDARARGKGVLLISGHFGGWEIGSLAIMAAVENVTSVARPLDNELLERDLSRIRERTGVELVDRGHAARPLLKALAQNRAVALLPDQAVHPKEGVFVPFLGRDAWTTDAPAKLAARTGSSIVMTFCVPSGTRHQIEFTEVIHVDELSEAERDPVALTTMINDALSRQIRERPELYWWMHNRWKRGMGRYRADASPPESSEAPTAAPNP